MLAHFFETLAKIGLLLFLAFIDYGYFLVLPDEDNWAMKIAMIYSMVASVFIVFLMLW